MRLEDVLFMIAGDNDVIVAVCDEDDNTIKSFDGKSYQLYSYVVNNRYELLQADFEVTYIDNDPVFDGSIFIKAQCYKMSLD